jgi:hypothetical protein
MRTADVCLMAQNLAHNCNYAVFPCKADKKPATPHGFHDATDDPDAVAELWRRYPGPLIGVATGEASGVSVIDLDAKHATAIAWWNKAKHRLPVTRTYRTRSGGAHLYYQHKPGIRNAQGNPVPGVDVRGTGGYVIFWFADGHECSEHSPPAEWPDWLTRFFWPPPKPVPVRQFKAAPMTDRELERIWIRALDMVRGAADGQKHFQVLKAARLLGGIQHRDGFHDDYAVTRLIRELPASIKDEAAAAKTITDGLAYGRGFPIEIRRAA